MSSTAHIGSAGEAAAARTLESMGMRVIAQNVRFTYGEIDIVAREKLGSTTRLHFVEVKSVARESGSSTYHPLQNVSREKIRRLRRAVQGFLLKTNYLGEWQSDIICVFSPGTKDEKVEMYTNQII